MQTFVYFPIPRLTCKLASSSQLVFIPCIYLKWHIFLFLCVGLIHLLVELRELKTFVDLASIATIEGGDLDAGRISLLHTSCTGYASLIYQLEREADFKKFMIACEPTFRALESDKALPQKLVCCVLPILALAGLYCMQF